MACFFNVMRLCFVLVCLANPVICDKFFRVGAVLSTKGETVEMQEAREGYELVFRKLNAANDGKGVILHGNTGIDPFHFKFNFTWMDDKNNITEHRHLVRKLLNKKGSYKVHFLAGSHPKYAKAEMKLANKHGILNYHCCVGPDLFYERDYPRVFGIQASNKEYTRMLIQKLSLSFNGTIAFIYETTNDFTRTTCEAAIGFAKELGTLPKAFKRLDWTFEKGLVPDEFFHEKAEEAKQEKVEVLIGCVSDNHGKMIVDAFHDIKYGLKATFLTVGPTKPEWAKNFFDPSRSNDVLSAAQWHKEMRYQDPFFGTTMEYTEQYNALFGKDPTYIAAGASAVAMTLYIAIERAFQKCDISGTNGDVEALLHNKSAIDCRNKLSDKDVPRLTGYKRILIKLAEMDIETFFGRVKFNSFRRNVGLDPVTTQIFQRKTASNKIYHEIEAVLPLGDATELLHFPASNPFKEDCTAGQHMGDDEFNWCLECNQGEYINATNAPHCNRCSIGQYQNKTGQEKCKKCPSGTTTVILGAKNIQDCVCAYGYYRTDQKNGKECQACPTGASCEGHNSLPIPDRGYWLNQSYPQMAYACDPPSICPGGNKNSCIDGYTGRLCSRCKDGNFSMMQVCRPCLHPTAFIFLYFALLFAWYLMNVTVSRNVSSLEMILEWAQLANIIGDINLNWTDKVNGMFGAANILDFDVDILEPSCIFPWGFLENFVAQLFLPLLLWFMSIMGYFGSAILFNLEAKKRIKLEGQLRDITAVFITISDNEDDLKRKWDTTFAKFLASVDITYVTIAKYCFDVFRCQNIAGVSVLRAAPSVECGAYQYHVIRVIAALSIVVYVVGYLAFITWKLRQLRKQRTFGIHENIVCYGFLYEKFEMDYWYTPVVILIRKLLFVVVLVYVDDPVFQAGILAVLISASLIFHVYTTPYVDTLMDILFGFFLFALMFEALGGLMFHSEKFPDSDRLVLEWIVLTALFLLSIVFLIVFVMELLNKYCARLLKAIHRRFAREQKKRLRGMPPPKNRFKMFVSFVARVSHAEDKEISFAMLDTFSPILLYRRMTTRPGFINEWDKLTKMMDRFMSEQSDVSYLSINPVAKFWRKMVTCFPVLVDFLAAADEEMRQHFEAFATSLFRDFYLTNKVVPLPLKKILNWRDHASISRWLATAPPDDRKFFVEYVVQMFRTVGDNEAADALESMYLNEGFDPRLEKRYFLKQVSEKGYEILQHFFNGSQPFAHSAAERGIDPIPFVIHSLSFSESDRAPISNSFAGANLFVLRAYIDSDFQISEEVPISGWEENEASSSFQCHGTAIESPFENGCDGPTDLHYER